MGVVRFSAEEDIWIFEYQHGLNCPFSGKRVIPVGAQECVYCPAFISVDRDRNKHTTILKCGGKRRMVQYRTYVERG
ncbi:MAG: hypothetical protein LBK40_00785 [Spirochaetaceae bacterium]|nr:hypothetical protein [Spirochaetaceae bacterium]